MVRPSLPGWVLCWARRLASALRRTWGVAQNAAMVVYQAHPFHGPKSRPLAYGRVDYYGEQVWLVEYRSRLTSEWQWVAVFRTYCDAYEAVNDCLRNQGQLSRSLVNRSTTYNAKLAIKEDVC